MEQQPESRGTWKLEGGCLNSTWDASTGRMLELTHTPGGYRFAETPAGFEIFDERDRVRYTDRGTPCEVQNASVTRTGALTRITFDKHFANAPFVVHTTLTSLPDGLRLEAEAVLVKQPDGRWPAQRNIRISFVLPAHPALHGWAPAHPDPSPLSGPPVRYCYGIQEPGLPRVGIPMYTVYRPGRAGLSLAMPLDLPKVQLNLGPEPEDPEPLYVGIKLGPPDAGASLDYTEPPTQIAPSDIAVIRLTELCVGLVADRPLRFAIRLHGHAPHWRPALGWISNAYPEYFRMHPDTRAIYGTRLGASLDTVDPEHLAQYRRFKTTSAWLHTHFYRHGELIPPEAAADPDFRFFCEPYSDRYPDNTVRKNRRAVDALTDNGQAVFLYGFNMHCDPATVAQRGFFSDVTRTGDGQITESYHRQPVMFFHPKSPFGSHQLRQMDLMMRLYPKILGVGLDNWAYGGIDFAHDDGITMFDHRTAASVNFSQQTMIGPIARKWHATGRLLTVNKARTVESLKGVDSMLTEARGPENFAMFAYTVLDRHITAMEYEATRNPDFAEDVLKYLLIWGGQMGRGTVEADPEMSLRYLHLIQGLRNRTWVFDPDPLTLPERTDGNLFRIHPESPWNPGCAVITLVRPDTRLRDRNFAEGLSVRLRLPENGRYTGASWMAVEDAPQTVDCAIEPAGDEIRISLPPLGAAGLLLLPSA